MRALSRIAGATAIATVLLLVSIFGAVPVRAADAGWIKLYDTGDPETATFIFQVWNPGYFTLEDEYLNIIVKSDPMVSGVGTNATYYVTVYIDDGITNYSWNRTVAAKNDRTVYSNISYADPGKRWVENASATIAVKLEKEIGGGNPRDYAVDDISIYKTAVGGIVVNMIPVIIMFGLVIIIMKWMKNMQKKT